MNIGILGTRRIEGNQGGLAACVAKHFAIAADNHIVTNCSRGINEIAIVSTWPPNLTVIAPFRSAIECVIPYEAELVMYDEHLHYQWRESVLAFHPNPSILTPPVLAYYACTFGVISRSDLVLVFSNPVSGNELVHALKSARSLKVPILVVPPSSALTENELIRLCEQQLLQDKPRILEA